MDLFNGTDWMLTLFLFFFGPHFHSTNNFLKRFIQLHVWVSFTTQLKQRPFFGLHFDFIIKFKKGKPEAKILEHSKTNFKVLN